MINNFTKLFVLFFVLTCSFFSQAQVIAPDEDTGTYTTCNPDGANATRTSNDLTPRVNVGTIDDRSCYANYKESIINGTTWGIYNITDSSNNQDAANTLQPRIERSLPRSKETGIGSYARFTGTVRILEVGDASGTNDDGTYIMQAKGKHTGGGGSPDPAICLYLAKPVLDSNGNQISFDIYREQINFRGGSGASGRTLVFLTNVLKNAETNITLEVGFRQDPTNATKKIHYSDATIGGNTFNWNIPEPERGSESGIRYGVYRVKGGRAQIRWANTTYNKIENEDTGGGTPTGATITSATSGDWNEGTTWGGGSVPTINDDVIIDHGVTIKPGMSAIAKSLTLNTGGGSKRLNINEGSNLTVNEDITLNRSQDGIFMTYSSSATNKDIGTVIFNGAENDKRIFIKKRLPSNGNWHLISTSGRDSRQNEIARTATSSDNYNIVSHPTKNIFSIASYNGNNNSGSKYEYIPDTGVLYANSISFAKSGYSVMVNNTNNTARPDILLRPKLNAANVTEDISAAGDGYNLIGNPFLAYLHANTAADATNNLLTVNSMVLEEQTIWIWNNAKSGGAGWETINLGDNAYRINPVQGFFVKAKSSGGTAQSFSFNKNMRTHTKSGEFLKSTNQRFEIDLSISKGKTATKTSIRYIENTSIGFDNGYDSSLFDGFASGLAIYTNMTEGTSEKKLAIQSLPSSGFENIVVPVGVTAEANSIISFTADIANAPIGYDVILEDRVNNVFTSLSSIGSSYDATVTRKNTDGRFFIHTTPAALSADSEFLNSIRMYNAGNNTLKIVGLQSGNSTLSLYNILGEQVVNTSFEAASINNITLPVLSTGVYVAQLTTASGGTLNKKIILK